MMNNWSLNDVQENYQNHFLRKHLKIYKNVSLHYKVYFDVLCKNTSTRINISQDVSFILYLSFRGLFFDKDLKESIKLL